MAKTYRVSVTKPVESATFTITLDDGLAWSDVWSEAGDTAEHLDALGKIEWDLPEWFVEVVDVEEVIEEDE